MRRLLITLLFSLFSMLIYSQSWMQYLPASKSEKQLTFYDYQDAFKEWCRAEGIDKNGYYNENGEKIKAGGWKQFKRWEIQMEGWYDYKTGKFYDINIWHEYEKHNLLDRQSRDSYFGNWVGLAYDDEGLGNHGNGRINCMAFHPANNNTYWIGAAWGGIWKTEDNGNSWTPLSDYIGHISIGSIAIPSDFETSNTIYIGTGDRGYNEVETVGVLKSTDGGDTWQATGLSFSDPVSGAIGSLLIQPSDNNILYAAATSGIHKSIDAGLNWELKKNIIGKDLEFHPANDSIIYASTRIDHANDKVYIYRSQDCGETWQKVFEAFGLRIELTVSADEPDWVYAVVSGLDGGLGGFYRSTDKGVTFQLQYDDSNIIGGSCDGSESGGQGGYDLCVEADPLDGGHVYIGGINVWESSDAGLSWSIINDSYDNCGGVNNNVHVDQHWLDYHPGTGNLFVCNDGGIYYSTNQGESWNNISGGLMINQPYRISNSQQVYNKILMGQQDNGSVLWENNTAYFVGGGDGTDCIINPLDHNHQIKTANSANVWFTLDSWTTQPYHKFPAISDPYDSWFKPIVLLPMDTIYYGVSNIWKSTDKGFNFTKICEVPDDSIPLRTIVIAPSNHQVAYFHNKYNLYKTTDDFSTFYPITGNLPSGFTPAKIYKIAVKNTDPNTLWITNTAWDDGHSVYKSSDGGVTWEDISAGLPDGPWYDIIQNKMALSYDELYVSGFFGVYVKIGESGWIPFTSGLPNVVSFDMDIYYDGPDSKLRAGTHGRGVWESDLFSSEGGNNSIWTGNYDDNWHDYRNWSSGTVPSLGNDATIQGNVANFPRVYQSNVTCGDVYINAGAQLSIDGRLFALTGDLVVYGTLNFAGPGSDVEIDGSIRWKAGSACTGSTSQNNNIRIFGDWTFDQQAYDVRIDSADVYFMGNTFSNIYNHGSGCGFGNLHLLKSSGKHVIFDAQSTSDLIIGKDLIIYTGGSLTHNSSKNLIISGNIHADGNLYFQDGTCILNGADATIHLAASVSFFNHLQVTANSGKVKTLTSDILVQDSLQLISGQLDPASYSIKLDGDLIRTAGSLNAANGRIVFRGSGRQTVTGNVACYTFELAKPGDTLFIHNSAIICEIYDFTEGALAMTGNGLFFAEDLQDDGIFGSFYLKDNCFIELTQDAGQAVDLNGIIRIEGGSFIVKGGSGTSQWPGGVNAELWISDGLLDFKNQGIHLSNSANFLEVITGGVIRTSKSFTGERNDFTPIGGRIELLGGGDADLSHGIGGAFWDVKIIKAGTVSAIQNLTVDNSVDIQVGTLDINGKTVHIGNQLEISDIVKMTLPSSQLSVDGDVIWKSGSSADISEGTITFKGNWYFNNGTTAQLAGNNTVKAISSVTNQYIYHNDNDACFANFSLEKPFITIQRHLVLDNSSDYPMRVNGNLTLLSNNSLRIDSVEMIVGGNVQTNSPSFIRVYETGSLTADNAIIDGVLNLFGGAFTANSATIDYGLVMTGNASAELNNLTLNGTIDLDDGSLVVHNNFSQSSGGHLVLDGGSFIIDKPYTGNMFGFAGTTDLNGGFFEISYEGIQFGTGATVNFNGGTLRVGGHFSAVNPNSFQPTSGMVELINTIGANIEVANGNYFHRLVINKSGYNPCLANDPLIVNDQMIIQQGEYYTLNHGLNIGDDLIIESPGKLTAGSAEIHVGGDWINNRGTAGFVENTSSVWLTPAQTSTVSPETFYELVIQASTDPNVFVTMAPGTTITVNGDLVLSEGAMLMDDNCTLNANGMVYIKNSGGLNANPDATGTVINCKGHWWDYNTEASTQRSFTCGQSTVNFTGASDQQLIAFPGAVFNHMNIQKTGGALLPSNNITVLGDMNLQSGEWDYASTGLTHTFMGDFNVFSGASWLDDQNTVSFEGELWQTLSNTTGNPLEFGVFRVDRPGDMSGFGSFTIDSDMACSAANFVSGWIYVADHDFDCMGDMNILEDTYAQFVFNSTIRMANNKMIHVNGGNLFIGGDPANRSLVTHLNTGYYKVLVSGGGQINSVYTTWEWLGTRGIEFAADGYVSGSFPFYECILRDGIPGGSLFYMGNSADITLHNVNFPANNWGSAYNVAKYEDAGNVYLPGAVGDFAGPAFEYDPHNRIHWPSIGVWEGDESTEWHELHNWRYDFQVPDASTDVLIPAGVTYYPDFHQVETTVNSLRIDAGASLTLSKDSLTVLTTTDIEGELNLSADYTALFTDSLVWQAGSSASVADRGMIFVAGNMFVRRGSGLNMTAGTIYFHGNSDSDLICHDTAQVFHLSNYKPAPYSLNLVGDTVARLTVSGAFRNGPGATLKCPSTQEWVFGGQFRNTDGGHFRCQQGTLRLTGATSSTYFRPNQGDYFNNLIIETTSTLNLNNTYSDSLRIHGNLTINPSAGTSKLTANNFKIILTGDWINNRGVSGFDPGTSTLALVNPAAQSVTGNTVFHDVEAGSSSPGLISFFGDNTINNHLWVVSPVEVFGTLISNIVFNDDGNSELHLRNGAYMQIGTLLQGGLVHGDGGTLMVSDLDEDYITGIYQIEDGLITLNQAEYDSPHDLRGNIIMSGGELRFTGGTGSSTWPSNLAGSYASITMTGGLLNLQNHYVDILNNNFTENISGGTIRVGYSFVSTLGVTTFNPTGGAVEIVSENDAGIGILEPESHFWDLIIDHSDAGGTTYPSSNFRVKNELKVRNGTLHIDGFEITVGP